jgi:hypothetical protein
MIVAELHGVATAARVAVEKLVASAHSEISTRTANQSCCRLPPVLFNARLPLLLLLTFRPLLSNPYPHRAYRPSCWRKHHKRIEAGGPSPGQSRSGRIAGGLKVTMAYTQARARVFTGRCHSHDNERAPWIGRRRKNYRFGKSSCRRGFHIQG